ncbi:RNA polymerase sigma factor [Novosphingobium sp. P6W]|nr:RNA polymerase sigma factor [Novosphingobium sp. P6W]AXB79888.1 RNA polymerase sigma factor [Novosphingobium sp. P6W]
MEFSKASKYAPGSAFSWARLRNQVARMTRRDDAEDLLHDAWVNVATGRAVVQNADALLARAATNRGIDAYRRERRAGETLVWDPDVSTVADEHPLQDEVLIARERLGRLRVGVEALSPRTRQIFLMYRLDGRKYREIAEELGISQSAVEKHIARAMAYLADWMENW